MRLAELQFRKEVTSLQLAYQTLHALGFSKIGTNSSYAYVFMHPKFDYILKIFKDDSCYMEFANLAKKNPGNPHFPKFRGNVMKVTNDIYAIRIEKLTPMKNSNLAYFIDMYLSNIVEDYVYKARTEKKFPDLIPCLDAIKTLISMTGCRNDAHADNIMLRGDVPVIIDPMAA